MLKHNNSNAVRSSSPAVASTNNIVLTDLSNNTSDIQGTETIFGAKENTTTDTN